MSKEFKMVILPDENLEEFESFLKFYNIQDSFRMIAITLQGVVYDVKVNEGQLEELYKLRYISYIMTPSGHHV